MSYRCKVCNKAVPRGRPRLVHNLYKVDGNISQEVPVCYVCKALLDSGVKLDAVVRQHAKPVVPMFAPKPVTVPIGPVVSGPPIALRIPDPRR